MTHREFLLWLQPRLENAATTGLNAEGLREVREALERMRDAGALQPFASRVYNLALAHPALDAAAVAALARETRSELVPAREKTVVFSAPPGTDDD